MGGAFIREGSIIRINMLLQNIPPGIPFRLVNGESIEIVLALVHREFCFMYQDYPCSLHNYVPVLYKPVIKSTVMILSFQTDRPVQTV